MVNRDSVDARRECCEASEDRTNDWTRDVGPADAELLRRLPFARLARVPPAKRGGLPLGHELRILRRFVSGGSSSLDPSGLAPLYRRSLRGREALLHRALVLREALPAARWSELLGAGVLADWRARELLFDHGGDLRCAFAVVPLRDLLFAVDPQEGAFAGKIHIGQDSLNLLEFADRRALPQGARLLDVGTGSGILLIGVGRRVASAVGVEINPRAARAARFNLALNACANAAIEEGDIFARAVTRERFDLALWNVPFLFLPDEERERSIDGYGGALGIELTLAFVERLPALLTEAGHALLLTAAPILASGENRLATELRARGARLGLDVIAHVLQPFWMPHLRAFHARHGVDHFESTIVELRHGTGRYEQRAAAAAQRIRGARCARCSTGFALARDSRSELALARQPRLAEVPAGRRAAVRRHLEVLLRQLGARVGCPTFPNTSGSIV